MENSSEERQMGENERTYLMEIGGNVTKQCAHIILVI